MKKEKGITLIALIVTIIVLLILAGISIGMLTSDNGIIKQAQIAKRETERSDIEEKINVIVIDNSKERVMDKDKLINDFENKLPEGKDIEDDDEYIYIIYPEYSFEVDINSGDVNDITKYIEISKKMKVGDYVEYKPQNEIKSYLVEEKYSGTEEQTIEQEEFKWRILNVNKNGTVDLISENSTSSKLALKGCIGYNNGVTLLNDICDTLYGNLDLKATARSINIEDIQDKLDLNVWDYKDYITGEGHKYGEVYTYTGKFPSLFKEDANSNNESKSFNLTAYENMESAISGPETLNIKNTVWNKVLTNKNFKVVESRDNSSDSEIYYNLLYKNRIWFASRCTYVWGDTFTYFGLFRNNNGTNIEYLFYVSTNSHYANVILPIINIPIDEINTDISYEENNIWKLRQ